MSFFPEFEKQIRQEAIAAYPNEAVWLITPGECRQVRNIHDSPEKSFSVAPADTAAAMGRGLLAVVHSHPKGFAAPSESDMRGQVSSAVPWGILTTDGVGASEVVWWGRGAPKAPLIGRGFRHGVTDCYALVKDYYESELGILLPEFPRSWEWWKNGDDLLLAGFAKAGFSRIGAGEAAPGNMWFAQVKSPVPNHCGLLLENSLTLHQPGATKQVDLSRKSIREPIYRYLPHITHWFRHEAQS